MSTSPLDDLAALRVDVERIKSDILALAEIGRDPENHGIYRLAFSEADMRGKGWLLRRIEAAGLPARLDGAGNVISEIAGEQPGPRIVVGSHIDTVPCAGALDGTLGVVAGLECLRRIREAGLKLPIGIELVAFSDEEGRFGGMFGSQAFAGQISPERIEASADMDGVLLRDALLEAGLDPMSALDACRDPATVRCYLELHIEQGPVLDAKRCPVGVVEDITGLFKWTVWLRGEANHAGTTPMSMRNDAFMGLAQFAHELPRILEENGSERSRATIGRAQILPGSANTVPGLVEFSLDVRDTSAEVLDELAIACRKALSAIARRGKLMFEFRQESWIEPVACDRWVVEHVAAAAEQLRLPYERLPSGAAHDAQIIASIAPVGMIFVPSRDGQSHSPKEWTSWNDIQAGADVMLQALLRMAGAIKDDRLPSPPAV
jgi:N-carbamoyl-L-amino-acid hydrolase